jgi:hypothetical protein
MRKQYHLRRGGRGFDAWDVDRLIELSEGAEVHQVALASIAEIDSVYWFGDGGEQPTVRNVVQHLRLIRETDLSHPIILDADGRVMDGMHRIAKALLEERTHIAAVQFDVRPEPDYRDCDPAELPYGH